tara:strand:+ start:46950 stop:48017 length:1068 start_codon:yes stop_codon:yes gene_type:complete
MIRFIRSRILRPIYGVLLTVIARTLNLFSPHRRHMHGIFHGNPSLTVNRIKNVLRPQRMRLRHSYGQIPGMSKAGTLATPLPRPVAGAMNDGQLESWFSALDQDGIVKLPFDFANEVAACKRRYQLDPSLFQNKNGYFINTVDPWADNNIMSMLCHPVILGLLSLRFGAQPILRHPPIFRIDRALNGPFDETGIRHIDDLEKGNAGFAQNWHADNADLMHVDVLFEDVDLETSHMEFAKRSHHIPFCTLDPAYDANFADKTVKSEFEIVPLIGKAGTVYVWSGNGLHRMRPVKNSFRSLLIFYSTPGNNLISNTEGWPPLEILDGSQAPEPADRAIVEDPLVAQYLGWAYPDMAR